MKTKYKAYNKYVKLFMWYDEADDALFITNCNAYFHSQQIYQLPEQIIHSLFPIIHKLSHDSYANKAWIIHILMIPQ